jgi:hypothetical protein
MKASVDTRTPADESFNLPRTAESCGKLNITHVNNEGDDQTHAATTRIRLRQSNAKSKNPPLSHQSNRSSHNPYEKWGLDPNGLKPYTPWVFRMRNVAFKRMPWKNAAQDNWFYQAKVHPIFVHTTLHEGRPGRSVQAWDIQGSCSYAVATQPVPDPTTLETLNAEETLRWIAQFNNQESPPSHVGAIRCRIFPHAFLNAHQKELWNQIAYSTKMQGRGAPDEPWTGWIYSCEWQAWSRWATLQPLASVRGVATKHPLSSVAFELWKDRERARQHNDTAAEATFKLLLGMLHTVCGPRDARPSSPQDLSDNTLWCIHHVPQAWTRAQWLTRAFECSMDERNRIVYGNVDSMHASTTQDSDTYPSGWGTWKLQGQGDRGFWLRRGRYWIANNEDLVLYQNYGSTNPWNPKRRFTNSEGKVFSIYAFRGISTQSTIYKKENAHYITFHALSGTTPPHRCFQDRAWKRKLWYFFKRGIYEKTKIT